MEKFLSFIALLIFAVQTSYGDSAAPLILDVNTCQPSQDEKLSSVSEIIFSFNFENVYTTYPDVEKTDFGICASMGEERYITVYKGEVENGDVLFTINQGISTRSKLFAPGETSLKLSLEQTYILEPGEKYTVHIPAGTFYTRTKASNYDTSCPEYQYSFCGEEIAEDELLLVEETPKRGSIIGNINEIQLEFNLAISVDTEASIALREGSDIIGEGKVEVDGENENIVLIKFPDTSLYSSHSYVIDVPSDIIFIKDTNIGNSEISLNYEGAQYKYLSYGRVSPPNNSEISYLSTIIVPIKNDGDLTLGRARAPKAYMYEGDGNEPMRTINCEMGEDGNSWVIPIWDFGLTASNSYRVEVPADQYHLWSTNDSGVLVEAKDTSNPELVLTYTTPEVLKMPAKVTIDSSIPEDNAGIERLDNVVLNLASYEFDSTSYMVYASSENPVAIFSDGSTQTNIPITFKDGEVSATISINRPLESGKEYTLTIPANTFIPHANENLAAVAGNEEVVLTFNGVKEPTYEVNLNFGDAFTITNVVNRGESATLTFSPAEDWAIDEVIVNKESKTVEDNKLVIPDVNEETNVHVTYKYVGEISFDYETGVDNVMGECPYSISMEPGYVIISNVELGATIDVYNTVGMLMATSTATQSTMKLGVNPGIVVVVIRNGDNTPVGITVKVPQ